MDHLTFVTLLVIAGGLLFSLANGWNDSANAIATVVCTRVLSPAKAVMFGAALNMVGALFSSKVAKTVGNDIADPAFLSNATFLAAVLAATAWVAVCTVKGLPISCSHSLMGGLVGAVIATAGLSHVKPAAIWKIAYGIFTAPVVGFLLGMALLSAIAWAFRRARPRTVNSLFGKLQIVSAGAMAFAHGTGDGQKAMGIIAGALIAGTNHPFEVPLWVRISCALVMGLGTAVGGWSVIKTLGTGLSHLRPWQGFAAEAASATTILSNTLVGIPLSTTHSITGAILGVGAAQGWRTVRWEVGKKIVYAWLLTFPVCIGVGALFAWIFEEIGVR
jgi:PiT family inorganic phosphate transporter